MITRTPHVHDVVRVHPGVIVDGRDLGLVLLTVKDIQAAGELDATETAGGRAVHLDSSQYDLVFQFDMGV